MTDSRAPHAADPLMGPTDVSKYVGIPVGTLYQWRHAGTGPRAIKVGKHLRYRRSDLEAWLASQEVA